MRAGRRGRSGRPLVVAAEEHCAPERPRQHPPVQRQPIVLGILRRDRHPERADLRHDRVDTCHDRQDVGELLRREAVQRVGEAGELLYEAVAWAILALRPVESMSDMGRTLSRRAGQPLQVTPILDRSMRTETERTQRDRHC